MSELGTLVVCSVLMEVVKLKQSFTGIKNLFFKYVVYCTYGKFEFVKICLFHFYVSILE